MSDISALADLPDDGNNQLHDTNGGNGDNQNGERADGETFANLNEIEQVDQGSRGDDSHAHGGDNGTGSETGDNRSASVSAPEQLNEKDTNEQGIENTTSNENDPNGSDGNTDANASGEGLPATTRKKRSRFDEAPSEEELKNQKQQEDEDALERVQRVAAKLSAHSTPGGYIQKQTGNAKQSKKVTKKVYIPVRENPDINYRGLIIGPRGETHRQLQEQSGAFINLRGRGSQMPSEQGESNAEDEDEDLHVVISGDNEEQVKKAEDLVREIIFDKGHAMDLKKKQLDKLNAESDGGDVKESSSVVAATTQSDSRVMRIPQNVVGILIGTKGDTIRMLQDKTGCSIQIERDSDVAPGETHRKVTIKGRPEYIDSAVREIERFISERNQTDNSGNNPSNSGNSYDDGRGRYDQNRRQGYGGGGASGMGGRNSHGKVTLEVPIPNSRAGAVIGKQGQTIKNIQNMCRAHIEVPQNPLPHDPNTRVLVVTADSEDAARRARDEILYVANMGSNTLPNQNAVATPAQLPPGADTTRYRVPNVSCYFVY